MGALELSYKTNRNVCNTQSNYKILTACKIPDIMDRGKLKFYLRDN